MINLSLLLAFLAAASILTMTPGVDTALVLRTVTTQGRHPAALAAVGVALGCLMWGGAVSLGLGALLRASEVAYTIVKFAGAAYLIWQGIKLLRKPRAALDISAGQPPSHEGRNAFAKGFLTNILNPKVGVFYVTFLPQFIPVGANVAAWSFFLAALHVMLTLAWFAMLVVATAPLTRLLRRPQSVRMLDQLTGVVFIGFGLKLATSSAR